MTATATRVLFELPAGQGRVTNGDEVWDERRRQRRARKGGLAGGASSFAPIRYDEPFEPRPRYAAPSSFAPDYVDAAPYHLVLPRLSALLDQPRGSLQVLPTETAWVGPEPTPDFSYLWLSYVPEALAVDLERTEAKVEYREEDGRRVPKLFGSIQGPLRLRPDLVPPAGLFRAVEAASILLATDAVAEAVVRAGCTGIEFLDPETAFLNTYQRPDVVQWRRGPDGLEVRPRAPELPSEPYALLLDPAAGMPPPGPPVRSARPLAGQIDWNLADASLRGAALPGAEDGMEQMAEFLGASIWFAESFVEKVLAAIRAAQVGHEPAWTAAAQPYVIVVRPDGVWLRYEDDEPEDPPWGFPLEDVAEVMERWRRSIHLHPHLQPG